MSYQPKPVDTSHIDISELSGLTEFLAEQAHEVWAEKRIKEGWTHGATRDDAKLQHPDLVPYQALPEGERQYDRDMSAQTLRLIRHQGHVISAPEKPVPCVVGEGPPKDDDMDDDLEVIWLEQRIAQGEHWLKPLADGLRWFEKELRGEYRSANQAAIRYQKLYLYTSFFCVASAGGAVVLAVLQLVRFGWVPHWLAFVELGLVVVAVGCVLADALGQWRDAWLVNRSKAEQLRSLKFRTLLHPDFWSSAETRKAPAMAKARLSVQEIRSMSGACLHDRLARHGEGHTPAPATVTGTSALDHAIGNYYLRRRLAGQAAYTHRKESQFEKAARSGKLLAEVLFFGVLVVVAAHTIVDLRELESGVHAPEPSLVTKILTMLAVLLPAAGASLHIFRAGREPGRNHLRFGATHKRLSALLGALEGSTSRREQIHIMMQAEAVLASEHEQWLQLMSECEWYG